MRSPRLCGGAGDHKPDPVQPAGLAALLGQDQVPEMDRIERAAEKTESHGARISPTTSTSGVPDQATTDFLVDKRAEIG